MNRAQKGAWFGLIISAFLLAVLVVRATSVPRMSRALDLFWLFATLGLIGLSVVSFRKKQSPAEVDIDERDKLISRRALIATYFFLWCLVIVLCVIPQFAIGQEHPVPLGVLPLMLLGIMIVSNLVYAAAILVQYRRGGKDGRR